MRATTSKQTSNWLCSCMANVISYFLMKIMRNISGRTPSLRQVESNPPTTKPMLSLYGVIAMSVVGGALLLFSVVFGIWLTRMHRQDEEDEHPIRNVNRVINSLKRGSSLGRQKRKLESSMTSSTESVDDIEQLVSKKNSHEEANDLPWYNSRKCYNFISPKCNKNFPKTSNITYYCAEKRNCHGK